MSKDDERWLDQDAGPLLRPYTITRGRTRVTGEQFDLLATVVATLSTPTAPGLSPEHTRILMAARRPISVADLASQVDMPLTVVRILLADLRDQGLVRVRQPDQGHMPEPSLLREVIAGLKAL